MERRVLYKCTNGVFIQKPEDENTILEELIYLAAEDNCILENQFNGKKAFMITCSYDGEGFWKEIPLDRKN